MVSTSYNDHIRVLNFYKMKIPKSKRQTKKAVERILAKKLCNCVSAIVKSKRPLVPLAKTRKRTKKAKEQAAVAICRNSIFRKKGIMNYTYTCKKKQKLIPGKNGDCLMKYTRKTSIKGGKKKRKYNKKGGNGDDVLNVGKLKSLTPDEQHKWIKNIRGNELSKEAKDALMNTHPFNMMRELIDCEDFIFSVDEKNYYVYHKGACDAGKYPKKEDECVPITIPIHGVVSPDNPFGCLNPPSNFSVANPNITKILNNKNNKNNKRKSCYINNSPTTITETNFPTVKKIR